MSFFLKPVYTIGNLEKQLTTWNLLGVNMVMVSNDNFITIIGKIITQLNFDFIKRKIWIHIQYVLVNNVI